MRRKSIIVNENYNGVEVTLHSSTEQECDLIDAHFLDIKNAPKEDRFEVTAKIYKQYKKQYRLKFDSIVFYGALEANDRFLRKVIPRKDYYIANENAAFPTSFTAYKCFGKAYDYETFMIKVDDKLPSNVIVHEDINSAMNCLTVCVRSKYYIITGKEVK